jgi:hypothetical protein
MKSVIMLTVVAPFLSFHFFFISFLYFEVASTENQTSLGFLLFLDLQLGATRFAIMTLRIMTLRIMTL